MSKIFTHTGSAHADELWACASLIAVDPAINEIVRSGNASGLNQEDYVVDVGGRFNPATRSYDHHMRNDPDVKEECAFSLVVRSNSLLSALAQQNSGFKALIDRVTLQDTQGLGKVADVVGSVDNALSLVQAEFALVRMFEQAPFATALMLAEYIRSMIREAQEIADLTAWLVEWAKLPCEPKHVVQIGKINVLYVADFDMYGVSARSFAKAIGNCLAVIGKETPIHATVSLSAQDAQTPGQLSIFRTKFGEGKIDLSKSMGDDPSMHYSIQFQHPAGFLCVLRKGQEHFWSQVIQHCFISRDENLELETAMINGEI